VGIGILGNLVGSCAAGLHALALPGLQRLVKLAVFIRQQEGHAQETRRR
jgi:hypothetical protein